MPHLLQNMALSKGMQLGHRKKGVELKNKTALMRFWVVVYNYMCYIYIM